MNGIKILTGDCRETLKTLPSGSVQCAVTSPPYWGLRDYATATWEGGDPECDHVDKEIRQRRNLADAANAIDGGNRDSGDRSDHKALVIQFQGHCGKCGARSIDSQIGLEETPEEYVDQIVSVFREVRRVLREDGCAWLNIGDSYSGSTMTGGNKSFNESGGKDGYKQGRQFKSARKRNGSLKPKDLVGIPWMVAFALRSDGWYLRQDIIWSKGSPMPESVTDRCCKSHEYIFLLTKSKTYFFDHVAIREPFSSAEEHAKRKTIVHSHGDSEESTTGMRGGHNMLGNPEHGRNKRSVWNVNSFSYKASHFATFPPKLIEPCILAGTSEAGCCPACGAPWGRVVETKFTPQQDVSPEKVAKGSNKGLDATSGWSETPRGTNATKTTGWQPTCTCGLPDSQNIPCTVLDPFNGSGTTGEVARNNGCHYIGCELNPEYVKLTEKRLQQGSLIV